MLVRHADFVCARMLGEAVRARGAALQFALFEFRMDHDVVLEAVKQDLHLFLEFGDCCFKPSGRASLNLAVTMGVDSLGSDPRDAACEESNSFSGPLD